MAGPIKKIGNFMDEHLMRGALKEVGISGTMAIASGFMGFKSARDEGKSMLGSIASGVVDGVMMDAIGVPTTLALGALTAAPKMAVSAFEDVSQMARSMSQGATNTPFRNATFADSQQAYTMRQAGMQMAQASKYNLQHALLGQEAKFLHQ